MTTLSQLINFYFPVSHTQGALSPLARDGSNFIVGTGIPADSAAIARHATNKLEIGLDVHIRQGPQAEQWIEGGETHYRVPTGTQDTDNGSSSDNPNRAAWNWTYSFLSEKGIDKFPAELWVDKDPTEGVNYEVFTSKKSPDGIGLDWFNEDTGLLVWSDDEGGSKVSQNSRNFAFGEYAEIGVYDFHDIGLGKVGELAYLKADARVDAGRGTLLDKIIVNSVEHKVDALNETSAGQYNATFGPGEFDIVARFENALGLPVLEEHIVVHVEDAII